MTISRTCAGAVVLLLCVATLAHARGDVADAAMNDDIDGLRALLMSDQADVNEAQVDGTTALHWAARWDDMEMADLLIEAGADVSARNRFGATPLYLSAVNGSPGMIEKLLTAGADVNEPVLTSGETPLMVASRTGVTEAVEVLIDNGAEVNATEELRGTTALMWAAEQNHANVIELLAQRGAHPGVMSRIKPQSVRAGNGGNSDSSLQTGGLTALALAAREGHLEAVRALVASGADVDQTTGDRSSPLLIAIMNGNYELAAYLLDQGANPNISNSRGWNPLYQTVKMRNLETGAVPLVKSGTISDEMVILRMLLDHGADPNLRMKANSQSRNGQGGTWLSEAGATPFLRAAVSGDLTVMRLLLEHGADPAIPTENNTTPLMAVAGIGYAEGFISHHSEAESVEALRLIMELGADVNAANDEGLTALHGAAHRGATEEIQILVDAGANMEARGDFPNSRADTQSDAGILPLEAALGARISAASPIYQAEAVDLITRLMQERGIEIPASTLLTIGGKRSEAGTGQQRSAP